jgi:hypothetical protein
MASSLVLVSANSSCRIAMPPDDREREAEEPDPRRSPPDLDPEHRGRPAVVGKAARLRERLGHVDVGEVIDIPALSKRPGGEHRREGNQHAKAEIPTVDAHAKSRAFAE